MSTETTGFTKYHMGIKPDLAKDFPRQVIHVGGFDFPLYSELVERTEGGACLRNRRHGIVRDLSDDEVTLIKERMDDYVVRGRRILSKKSRRYRAQPGDTPVSTFLYLSPKKVDDVNIISQSSIDREALKQESLARSDQRDDIERKISKNAKQTGTKR